MNTKKPAIKKPPVKNLKVKEPEAEELQPEETQPQETPSTEASAEQLETPPEPVTSTTEPDTPATAVIPPTIESIYQELQSLKQLVGEHTNLITQLQETLARKRKPPVSNGKVQILDKQTGEIYRSKNNAYQTLLKSGDLKELIDTGVFGDIPQKNTFGWYALVRELPDRFEEVKPPEGVKPEEEIQQ